MFASDVQNNQNYSQVLVVVGLLHLVLGVHKGRGERCPPCVSQLRPWSLAGSENVVRVAANNTSTIRAQPASPSLLKGS